MAVERAFWLRSDGRVVEITGEHPDRGGDWERFRRKYWDSGRAILEIRENGDLWLWKKTPLHTMFFELKRSHLKALVAPLKRTSLRSRTRRAGGKKLARGRR